jgi:hypothetical protein
MMIIIRKEDRTYREAVWAYPRLVENTYREYKHP